MLSHVKLTSFYLKGVLLLSKTMMQLCNIYAQQTHHFEAFILGNKKGLIELRNAIDRALETGSSVAHLFQSDYEAIETEYYFSRRIHTKDDAVDPITS